MPGVRTHDLIGTCAAPVLGVAVYQVTQSNEHVAIAIGAHMVGTFLMSPDLDIETSEPARRWGPLRWLWYPYGRIIPHRSILSHSGLSALLRLAYLAVVVELALLAGAVLGLYDWREVHAHMGRWLAAHQAGVGCVLVGLVVSDMVHTVSDHISTAIKVRMNGGKYRRELQRHMR